MAEYVRVRDKETGHHYTTAFVDPERHQVLNQDALDATGRPRPPKHNTSKRPANRAGETEAPGPEKGDEA